MGRNGGARETWSLTRNTVRDTPTRAVLVQESLWNLNYRHPTSAISATTKTPPPSHIQQSLFLQTINLHLLHFLLAWPLLHFYMTKPGRLGLVRLALISIIFLCLFLSAVFECIVWHSRCPIYIYVYHLCLFAN